MTIGSYASDYNQGQILKGLVEGEIPINLASATLAPGALGPGSVERGVADELRGLGGPVARYGAVGDGATDDSTKFAAAFADTSAREITLAANKTYLVGALTIPDWITLRGAPGATIKAKSGINGTFVTLAGVMKDVTLDCNGANQSSGHGVNMLAGARIQRCTVINAKGCGIVSSALGNLKVTESKVYNSGNNGILIGEPSAGCYDVVVKGNLVDRSAFTYLTIVEGGIKVHGHPVTVTPPAITINDVDVSGNRVILPTAPFGTPFSGGDPYWSAVGIELWGSVRKSAVRGNLTYGGYIGISIDRSVGVAVGNNIVESAFYHGIEIAGSSNIAVTGNPIIGNDLTRNGIYSDPGADHSYNISINGNPVAGTRAYAIIAEQTTGLTISGNPITTGYGYGIYLKSCGEFAVSGNQMTGGGSANSQAGVLIDQSSEGAVTGNFMKSFNIAVSLLGTTAYTFSDLTIASNQFKNTNANVSANLSGGAAVDYATVVIDGNNAGAPSGRKAVTSPFIGATSTVSIGDQENTLYVRVAASQTATYVIPATVIIGREITIVKATSSGTIAFSGTVDGGTPASLTTAGTALKIQGGYNSAGTAAWTVRP